MKPVEKISAWLFTTARNKITDLFRKKKAVPFSSMTFEANENEVESETEEFYTLFPDPGDNPELLLMREVVRDEMNKALNKMPRKHRDVFIQTEMEGKSFKEISSATGVPVNTLISRKHYAVLFLRERLQEIYDELLTN
jgi:RNA polymerase sigma factor (sigma-70 family)